MAKGLYDDDNIVKSNWAKWDKVGNTYEGVYVAREQRENTLKGDGSMQTIYTLVQEDESTIKVGGPGGRDLSQLHELPFGAYVGIKYMADIEPKKPGYNPSKSVCVFCEKDDTGKPTDMRLDVYKSFKGELYDSDNEAEVPDEL